MTYCELFELADKLHEEIELARSAARGLGNSKNHGVTEHMKQLAREQIVRAEALEMVANWLAPIVTKVEAMFDEEAA